MERVECSNVAQGNVAQGFSPARVGWDNKIGATPYPSSLKRLRYIRLRYIGYDLYKK